MQLRKWLRTLQKCLKESQVNVCMKIVMHTKPHPAVGLLLLHPSFYGGSTPILRETNCVCDHFQFPCHSGSHILSLRVDRVLVAFSWAQILVWLLVLGIIERTDVYACNCTQGLYKHRKRVRPERWLWETNPLPHQGVEPASTVHWARSLTNCQLYPCLLCGSTFSF